MGEIKNILVAENIFVSNRNKDILKGVTIRAEQGNITGLIGNNGAGKTTMLKTILGIQKAQDCDVFLNGKKIIQPFKKNKLLNYLPQHTFLPQYTTLKKILKQFNIDKSSVLDFFPELEEDLSKQIFELSGGRERLWSALILILADTKFTMLDEPFSHIMPLHVEQLVALILSQKEKKGFIITDHIYRPVLNICDMVYIMKEGKTLLMHHTDDLVLHGYIR